MYEAEQRWEEAPAKIISQPFPMLWGVNNVRLLTAAASRVLPELAALPQRCNEGSLGLRSHTVSASPLYLSDNNTKWAVMILQADR